jgi:UPF0716 protein FxsA
MPLVILFILIGIPIIELTVLVRVADDIGAFNTVMLSILTAVIGLWLVRQQGLAVVQSMQQSMAQGQSPVREMIHGFFLFFAGIFLMFPGFITDSIGALLILPPVRHMIVNLGFLRALSNAQPNPPGNDPEPGGKKHGHSIDGHIIIDGDFREENTESNDNEPKKD